MCKLFFPAMALACCATAHADAGVSARLDSIFESRYTEADAPGAAVIVALGDSVLYERYFGIADMATGERVSADTRFNIASVSKQMTVAALLQTGVDIDRPASDFFDYPQPFWHDVTLRHLASHTSGIPDSRDRSDRMVCVLADDETSQAYFSIVDSLQFAPGTQYDYLNPSFILLARVVEKLSGMEFTQYQQQHIFDPLGMTGAYYFDRNASPAHTAHGYIPDGDGWKEYDFGEETFFATRPDGGVYATARDMLRWEAGLADARVIAPALLREAYTPQIEVWGSPWCDYQNRPDTYYGLGWFIDTTPGHPIKVYHTGDNGGFQAYVAKYPDTGLRIIVLENRNDRDRWKMALDLDRVLLAPLAGR